MAYTDDYLDFETEGDRGFISTYNTSDAYMDFHGLVIDKMVIAIMKIKGDRNVGS